MVALSFPKRILFIHSLFRAGSTYFFHVFRRSNAGYWCYQEPLHEFIYLSLNNLDDMLTLHHAEAKKLRHPVLEKPYYQELIETKDDWQGTLTKESIYDHYFVPLDKDESLPYFRALIHAAKGVPVIQECRTASRIANCKKAFAGTHLYLWRNPWDQWRSYQVDNYFNSVTQLIINAPEHPPEVAIFRKKIAFQAFNHDNMDTQMAYFKSLRVEPAVSYQSFYLLFCLGLREAWQHADNMVNIDTLSTDLEYRASLLSMLNHVELGGCDFSDCAIPQAFYSREDQAFFYKQENSIHAILKLAGWTDENMAYLHHLRKVHQPQKQRGLPNRWSFRSNNTYLKQSIQFLKKYFSRHIKSDTI